MVSCYRFSPVAGSLNPTAEQAVSGHLQRSKNQLLACVPEKGLFVGRENYPLSWVEGAKYEWGKAQVLSQGSDVVLIASGPLLSKAIEAGKKLGEKGKKATVINNAFINHVDLATIGEAVKQAQGRVVTIEDHQIICGMGAQISHSLSNAGIAHRIKSLGIRGEFGQSAYVAEDLYKKHGLTGEKMAEAALELIG